MGKVTVGEVSDSLQALELSEPERGVNLANGWRLSPGEAASTWRMAGWRSEWLAGEAQEELVAACLSMSHLLSSRRRMLGIIEVIPG